MLKRVAQLLAVTLATTIGVFVFAAPASASVGGCTPTNVASPCVNWGDVPIKIRADFYMNMTPNSEHYYYRVAIHIMADNGSYDNGAWVSPLTKLDHTGHYCCWTRSPVPTLPMAWRKTKTVLYIYTSGKVLHNVLTSPIVRFKY